MNINQRSVRQFPRVGLAEKTNECEVQYYLGIDQLKVRRMSREKDTRLEQIETRLAYQEHTIETLSDLVYEQQQKIVQLSEQHSALQHKFNALSDSQVDSQVDAQNVQERPPHY